MSDPTGGSTLRQLIDEHAARSPDAAAILAPGRRPLTYRLLSRQIADVVSALNARGVGRHDRVATVIPDGPDMAVACLAVSAGATCVPLNPGYTGCEFEDHLARLQCRALLVPAGATSPAVAVARARGIRVLELIPAPDGEAGRFAEPDDVALVLPTSGTAAQPKMVPLTHRNVCVAAQNIRAALELTPSDRCLSVMPLFHIHGLSALFASMAAGASVVCPGAFAARPFFQWMEEFEPTWYTAAPATGSRRGSRPRCSMTCARLRRSRHCTSHTISRPSMR